MLYSTEQMGSKSFANKQHALKEIGPIWKSLPESERNHWEEKAEIENEKRAEANRPAILEALKNDDILALTNHEFKKYKPNQQFIYLNALSVLRLNITRKILNEIKNDK